MEKARCDICGHVNDIPRHFGDWQCSQCQQGYEYEEGHAIKLTDAQRKLLRDCRWIPVSERLPKEGEFVLVCDMETANYLPDRGMLEDGEWFISDDPMFVVTHWMPLPEPPSA